MQVTNLGEISLYTRTAAAAILLLALTSCQLTHSMPPTPVLNSTWLDLLPGWRLRVVVPVLKNPMEPYALTVTPNGPLSLNVTAAPNLKGFETRYYSVRGKRSRVRIRFIGATQTVNGLTEPAPTNRRNYFPLPTAALHMRLIFLARSSEAPHNMALIYTSSSDTLQNLSDQVIRNPGACDLAPHSCLWIPTDIAVRAEHLQSRNDPNSWRPVQ